jgi:hypothetical protein
MKMRNIPSSIAVSLLSLAGMFSSLANASVIYKDFSDLGVQKSPAQIVWNLEATDDLASSSAILDFELTGFKSLDGYNNCCTDTFHLWVNNAEVFTGAFNMGGGGSNKVLFNPNGGTAVTTTYGATDNTHNSRQATWAGGATQVSLPIDLLTGTNSISFSYSGYTQNLLDEGWGVKVASISKATVPEPSNFMLLMAGLAGIVVLRRRTATA